MAIFFDGISSYPHVRIGNPSELNITGDITVMAWVYVTGGLGQQRPIIGKGDFQYMLRIGDNTSPSNNNIEFYTYDGSWHECTSNVPVNLNEWHHAVGRVSGTEVSVWVDGVKMPDTEVGGINSSSTEVWIANQADNTGWRFTGQIEDARIYNRALSQAEIQTIYACNGSDCIVDGLVGRWKLDEKHPDSTATGSNTIIDSSNSGNHGTPFNSPLYKENKTNCRGAG